ncbi:efflux RND transporter periplasmic adaptor subunit [Dyadobacter sp. CY326]|uniref:efflux RND transporter periplasmic adaptor subunit n=1 Tax=Dyadobacter sp. CY326 TaxID=2907300 RepID=UPI001F335757|nr:efflux RND transporter periplasmic adaptor subunit [Dyadobacter sp. CY326]MCE7066233.1 efflux RND transporter periplasmic adaptor subunit [Dyadobacter sp. CY326]
MRTIMLVGGIIIVLVLGKLFVFSKPGSDKPAGTGSKGAAGSSSAGAAVPVNVYVVRQEAIENQIFASGTVIPNEEVNVMAEASGRLIKLDIKEGAYIEKGQLIGKINDRELRAQLQKVTYNQELSKKIEARQKKLLNVEAINLEEYDVTSNNIRVLDAEREVIEAQLAKTEIRAPFSGKIGLKYISEGAYLLPGTSIVTIVQSNPVKVDFTVPEKYSPNIKVGNVVKFNLDGDQSTYNARILAVDPKVDESLRTLKVRAVASNPNGRFVPGMFVKILANLDANRSAMMIPTESIVPVLKGKKVFLVKNGKAQEAMVVTGLRTDKKIQVIEGLQPGDSVITSGIIAIKANAAVKVN